MRRYARLALMVVVAAILVAVPWWMTHRQRAATALILYGNVDLREIQLPFHDSERVAQVLVQEGDHVRRGQLLAVLDTARLMPLVARSQAQVAAQQQVLLRLMHGNRPQEVEQARSAVAAAQAVASNTQAQYARMRTLAQNSQGRAVSRQDLDAAKAASDSAQAQLVSAQKALALERLGPRAEDIAQARAQLSANEADLAVARQQLQDSELRAPLDTVVRSRLIEPGEMVSPAQPAFTLSIVDPKWVRAYVDESDLGLVREGMAASVTVDSFPTHRFSGWVGFISSEAEFTPKTVQTTQLRSSLVYEVRIFVRDPGDQLRLGMPATVTISAPARDSQPLGPGSDPVGLQSAPAAGAALSSAAP